MSNSFNALKNGNCCSTDLQLMSFVFVTLLFVLKLFAIFTVNDTTHISLWCTPQLTIFK